MLTKDGIGACCVSRSNDTKKIIGLITDGDLEEDLKTSSTEWSKLKAENLMTYDPITIYKIL